MKRSNHAYLNPLLRLTATSLLFDALLLLLLSTVPSLASEALFGNVFSIFWLMVLGVCLGVGLLVVLALHLRRNRPTTVPQRFSRRLRELLIWTVVALAFCFNTVLYSGSLCLLLRTTADSAAATLLSVFAVPPLVIAGQLGAMLLGTGLAIATVPIQSQPSPFRWPRRTLLICAVTLCLSVFMLANRLPTRLAFRLVRPTLEQALQNPESRLSHQRVGLYRIQQQSTQANGSTTFTLDSPRGIFSVLNDIRLCSHPRFVRPSLVW